MAARRSKGKGDENRSITPDQPGRDSPRSRKCLDLTLQGGKKTAAPLSQHNGPDRGWHEVGTPVKRPLNKAKEVRDGAGLLLSSPSRSPPGSPELIPDTPKQVRQRFPTFQAATPKSDGGSLRRKRGFMPPAIPEHFKQAPPSSRKQQPQQDRDDEERVPRPVEKIAAASFYSGVRPLCETSQGEGPTSQEVRHQPPSRSLRLDKDNSIRSEPRKPVTRTGPRPTGGKANERRHSAGGVKRKRGGGDGLGVAGVSHAIRRPKKKPSCHVPPIKISELPTVSIEIPRPRRSLLNSEPASSSSLLPLVGAPPSDRRGARTPSSSTPKTGNFRLSKETRVDVEVKAGQIVYRKMSKISGTPLRRSPRKQTMSPLKQNYLAASSSSHAGGRRSGGGGQKLFSPQGPADFLGPETGHVSSPRKLIPSPVKFRVAAEEEEAENDFSQLINNLEANDDKEADEEAAPVVPYTEDELAGAASAPPDPEELPDTRTADSGPAGTSSQFISDEDCARTALQAVSEILGGISNMDTGEESAYDADMAEISGEKEDWEKNSQEKTSKLFPIFYQSNNTGLVQSSPAPVNTRAGGRRLAVSRDQAQLQIDAGQERGPTLCLTCGTVYSKGDPADEANHEKLHSGVVERLLFPGWRDERVGGLYGEGRVVVVQPGDPPHMWRKVMDALRNVDRDLGFSEVGIRAPEKTKAFLYISQKRIVGLLLAEVIQEAHKMVVNEVSGGKMPMCSDLAAGVKCGISRIWVLPEFRRKKVASSLVDTMRVNFIIGEYLGDLDFAFSDPTLNGYDFATSYLKRSDFLVYNR